MRILFILLLLPILGCSEPDAECLSRYEAKRLFGSEEAEEASAFSLSIWDMAMTPTKTGNVRNNLGLLYANGEGVPENDVVAVKCYRLAAGQGHAEGQFNLGVMYDDGKGVPENDLYAYVWFSVAAAQGNEAARGNRDRLKNNLSKKQQLNGQMLATKCFNSHFKDCPF